MTAMLTARSCGIKKSRSGARNADALFRAWLTRTKIPVEGSFVSKWIEDALTIYNDHPNGKEVLAETLGITKRSLMDAKNQKVRPMVTTVEKLADILGRSNQLVDLLPVPGKDGWGEDTGARFCGDERDDFKGCGTMFHPHKAEGLCEDCHDHKDNPDFVSRDMRMAQAS